MATAHLNPGQRNIVSRLISQNGPTETAGLHDRVALDEIRERAKTMWRGSAEDGPLPTTYQTHFQGIQVVKDDRAVPRPLSPTRNHKPQSSRWFYTTTFSTPSGYKTKGKVDNDVTEILKLRHDSKYDTGSYAIDRSAADEVDKELERASRGRTDGSTFRGDFSIRPEWRPSIVHHRLRGLSPPPQGKSTSGYKPFNVMK